MKTVGLPISHKENERRRALVPEDIERLRYPGQVFIETGYGDVLGYTDEDYLKKGVHIVTREESLSKDIVCDPKIGDAEYLGLLNGQTVFGWIHAVQNRDITDALIQGKATVYAWEDMYEDGRHSFWKNNEIAGEAAVYHAYMCHGVFPHGSKAAVLGRGNTARGAVRALNYMGALTTVYDRKTEHLFRSELGEYDVIVNSILWDTSRKDHIIYRDDLKRMKKGALLIDISCDRNGGIETSVPTTILDPTYVVDGITHYVVDHTPALFWKTTSDSLSKVFARFIDELIEDSPGKVLLKARIMERGNILDPRIIAYQHR
jgi:N5-(carboxyethyl)ornithine synthase